MKPETPELLITWIILLGALVGGWLMVRAVRQWRKQAQAPGPDPAEQLAHFQQLFERGELSAAEWERIRTVFDQEAKPAGPPGPAEGIQAQEPPGR